MDRSNLIAEQIVSFFPSSENAQDDLEYVWIVAGKKIEGKNQKAQFINAFQKMYELSDKEDWKKIELKGIANAQKSAFTDSQQKYLTNIHGLYVNVLASIDAKSDKLAKIAKKLKISFQVE